MGKEEKPTEEEKMTMDYVERERWLPKRPLLITKEYKDVLAEKPEHWEDNRIVS